jgi:hypothetical protein
VSLAFQAPASFGAYIHDLSIGNVAGAGNINVSDPSKGAYLGQLDQPDGTPIAITGLWDLEIGDGTPHGGKTNQLCFDAGPNTPGVSINGLFGVIQPAEHQGPKAAAMPCARWRPHRSASGRRSPGSNGNRLCNKPSPTGRRLDQRFTFASDLVHHRRRRPVLERLEGRVVLSAPPPLL